MKTVTITSAQFQRHIGQYHRAVREGDVIVIVTQHTNPTLVAMSYETFENLVQRASTGGLVIEMEHLDRSMLKREKLTSDMPDPAGGAYLDPAPGADVNVPQVKFDDLVKAAFFLPDHFAIG